jgi:formamidopyrimidine-DNA glycosylase
MPEYPEITSRAREMKKALVGKTFTGVEVLQPKSLNVSKKAFVEALRGAKVIDVSNRGKWIFLETTKGWLLLNLGMGGEILRVTRDTLPKKHRLIFDLDDGTCLTVNFWWVGLAHYVKPDELKNHEMTAKLGPNVLDLTESDLKDMLRKRRGAIKSFLLNQKNIAGIGNAYIHDILFMAKLHPLRTIDTLTEADVERLARAIHDRLQPSLDKGGAFYEVSIHGKRGGFTMDDILIGYKEGTPCPVCGAEIVKIKTGSTSSFICPKCQQLSI